MFLMPWRRQAQSSGLSRRMADPFDQFRSEMDTLIEQFFGGPLMPTDQETGSQRFWGLEFSEEGNDVVIRADVPGFEEKDLEVNLDGDVLTIKAEKKQEGEAREGRSYRSYSRTVTLPPALDNDKAQATCHNGVLELRIPRSPRAQGRRIPVQGRLGAQPASQPAQKAVQVKEGNGAASQQEKQLAT